ncbi:hypothetical protein QQ045_008553 [Rhodiola kirilowii]
MARVKSGCILSFLILAIVNFSYGQGEKQKAHKTSHAAARTLPSLRRARPSLHSALPESKPSPYRPRSGNPTVPYYPFFPLPPPPSHRLPNNQPPRNKKPYNPPSKGNPIIPYFPFFTPPPPPPPQRLHSQPPIRSVVSFSYGYAEKDKGHKTSHAAETTLPNAYFLTKYAHSFGIGSTFPSMHMLSFSIAHHTTIPVSVNMLVLSLRCARLSQYPGLSESKPSPYRPRPGNPKVPYYPFFLLPPPPSHRL